MRARASEPVKSPCGKWEVTPRKYYDTLNVVVVLKGEIGFGDTGDKILSNLSPKSKLFHRHFSHQHQRGITLVQKFVTCELILGQFVRH